MVCFRTSEPHGPLPCHPSVRLSTERRPLESKRELELGLLPAILQQMCLLLTHYHDSKIIMGTFDDVVIISSSTKRKSLQLQWIQPGQRLDMESGMHIKSQILSQQNNRKELQSTEWMRKWYAFGLANLMVLCLTILRFGRQQSLAPWSRRGSWSCGCCLPFCNRCAYCLPTITTQKTSWDFLMILSYHVLVNKSKAASAWATSGAAGASLGAVTLGPSYSTKHILDHREWTCFRQLSIIVNDQAFTQVDLWMAKAHKMKNQL